MPQLFTSQHYDAFTPPKPDLDDNQARLERQKVQDQFLWLHSALGPFIKSKKWDLHSHHQTQHITSSTHHVWINKDTKEVDDKEGSIGRWTPIIKEIGWLWLHYGKSHDQLNHYHKLPGIPIDRDSDDYSNAFYVHTRIQFYLNNEIFGVWLLQTDKNRYDRSKFLESLRDVKVQKELWKRTQPFLGKGFVFANDDEIYELNGQATLEDLLKIIRRSREGYTGFRKTYKPDDPKISVENIVNEMKENLTYLYPLYELMSYRPPKIKQDLSGLFGGVAKIRS